MVSKQLKKMATDEAFTIKIGNHIKDITEDADVKLQWIEYEKILEDAISHLPPQRQKIFRMCRQEDKSYEQVANELNISRNTVKEHMVLGTKFLKTFIPANYKIDLLATLTIIAYRSL